MVKEFYEKFWRGDLPTDKMFCQLPTVDEEENYRIKHHMKDGKSLDFGCGTGHTVDKLDMTAGVDISEAAVKLARKLNPLNKFYTLKNAPDEQYDNIVAADVLEHILDIDDAFDFIDKHLKHRGRLIIATNEISFLKLLLIGAFYIDTYFHPYSPHIRFFTRFNLMELLKRKGYQVLYCSDRGRYYGILSKGLFVVAEKEKDD